jgi:hypothetical protein
VATSGEGVADCRAIVVGAGATVQRLRDTGVFGRCWLIVSDEEHERASDERSDPEADSSADGVADLVTVAGRSTVDPELGYCCAPFEEDEQQ